MKRIVICLLSALLLLNLLACGKKDPEPSKPESPFDLGNYVSTGDRIVDPQNLEGICEALGRCGIEPRLSPA